MEIKIDTVLSCISLAARFSTRKNLYDYLISLKKNGNSTITLEALLPYFYEGNRGRHQVGSNQNKKLTNHTTLREIFCKLFDIDNKRDICGDRQNIPKEKQLLSVGLEGYLHYLTLTPLEMHICNFALRNSQIPVADLCRLLGYLDKINRSDVAGLTSNDLKQLLHTIIETYPDLLLFVLTDAMPLNDSWGNYSNAMHHLINNYSANVTFAHIMVLLERDANCEVTNDNGNSVLHLIAASETNCTIIQLYQRAIALGADPKWKNDRDQTAFQLLNQERVDDINTLRFLRCSNELVLAKTSNLSLSLGLFFSKNKKPDSSRGTELTTMTSPNTDLHPSLTGLNQ